MSDSSTDEVGLFFMKFSLRLAELRCEINEALETYPRTPDGFRNVLSLMRRLQAMEQEYLIWEAQVPDDMMPRTVAWVDNIPGGDISKAEVCPGKVDVYSDMWLANMWNYLRLTRLLISGAIVRCAAWMCSPVDYRTTPEYAQSARLSVDIVTDIIASVPYQLGWSLDGRTDPESKNSMALGGVFSMFHLFSAGNMDYISDAQRKWVKGRLIYIATTYGINQARSLSTVSSSLSPPLASLLTKPGPTPPTINDHPS